MPLRSGGPAPYAPGSTVTDLLQTYRDRGLATPFTPEVLLRAGVMETLVPRTLVSLRHLDLIGEDGMPTAALESLRIVAEAEYKQRLEEVIRAVYAEVFQFADPAKDDLQRINDAFRSYTPAGQRRRMVALFLSLCETAGIVPQGKRPAPATGSRSARAARPPRSVDRGKPTFGAGAAIRGDGGVIPPALTGLLAAIPLSRGWSKAQRDRFMDTFGHVLDFTVPIISAAEAADEAPDEEE